MFESLVVIDPDTDEAALIARIAELETLKAAAAAGQARLTAAFAVARRARETAAGMPAARRGRGVAAEIALARRDSPNRGNRHLGFANALVHEMPHTLAADAKAIAYRLDPHAVVDRAAKAETERCVTIRPAPDTMTYLTALLPVAQGVSVYAALKSAADTCFDGRSRGQVMADTLIERVTGRAAATATPIAVNLVLSDKALMGGHDPARIDGYGPLPAGLARALIAAAVNDDQSQATLRKLYATPTSGALVAMESTARIFPKGLARFIGLRDQRCRTPYCDAPIRHTDHATTGGPTSALNGDGLCEACNYTKQAPGWTVITHTDSTGTHITDITTPTGAHHHSQAPPVLPGRDKHDPSAIEHELHTWLCDRHAA
jgi:hypothetical protein